MDGEAFFVLEPSSLWVADQGAAVRLGDHSIGDTHCASLRRPHATPAVDALF